MTAARWTGGIDCSKTDGEIIVETPTSGETRRSTSGRSADVWNMCVSGVCLLCVQRSEGSSVCGSLCMSVSWHFKDTLIFSCAHTHTHTHTHTHLITFEQDKALIWLLIKTSLAKVTGWETGTVGCVCGGACTCLCACFPFSVGSPPGRR